jgi:hypothetical protein
MTGSAKGASVCLALSLGLIFLVAPLPAQQGPQEQEAAPDSSSALESSASPAYTARNTTPGKLGEIPASRYEAAKPKDDRIFNVMPNYETVEGTPSAPPLSAGGKWKLATQSAFDPFEFALSGVLAGASQAENDQISYGQGAAGYGKRYGEAFANQAIADFMSGAVFPTLLHEDPRYFQLGTGTFRHRFAYALSRVFLTPTDSGKIDFNYSEFLGNAAAAGIANTYNSPEDRTASSAGINFGEQLAFDMMGNELREFWPDIRRKFFHKQ